MRTRARDEFEAGSSSELTPQKRPKSPRIMAEESDFSADFLCDEEFEQADPESQASTPGNLTPRREQDAERSLFGSSSDSEQEGHVDPTSDISLLSASTKISARLSQRQIEHIKHLRQERDDQAKRDRRLQSEVRKQQRRDRQSRLKEEADEKRKRDFVLSITIEWQNTHVPVEVYNLFCKWLGSVSSWWSVAYEKGASLALWHLQAAAVIRSVSVDRIRKDWYQYSGWSVCRPPVSKVNCCFKEATGKGLHTQHGLLGYTRKDLDKYEGHQWSCHPSVTPEELKVGDDLFVQFGRGIKGNTCQLTESNFLDRALIFFDRFLKKNPGAARLDYVLREMLRSGLFSIHGKFLTHHGTFNYQRSQLAFISRIWPESVESGDVRAIFFSVPKPRDNTELKEKKPIFTKRPETDPFVAQDEFIRVPFGDSDDSSEGEADLRCRAQRAECSRAAEQQDRRERDRVRPSFSDVVLNRLADTWDASDRRHADPRLEAAFHRQDIDPNMLQDNSLLLRDTSTAHL